MGPGGANERIDTPLPARAQQIRLGSVRGPRRVVVNWSLGLVTALALSLPATVEAHVLSVTRARASFLEYAYGVAYSYRISTAPRVRCARSGQRPHRVYCDWSFVQEQVGTNAPVGVCAGRYRLFIVNGSYKVRRAVVRRLTCTGPV